MNNRIANLEQNIASKYNYVSVTIDKKTKEETKWTDYSICIEAFESEIEKLKITFPSFRFTRFHMQWWLVYFNKPLDFVSKNDNTIQHGI